MPQILTDQGFFWVQLGSKMHGFRALDQALSGTKAIESSRFLVGAVGIELKAALKTRKLLILLTEKNAKNTGIAQLRYTPGTLSKSPIYA